MLASFLCRGIQQLRPITPASLWGLEQNRFYVLYMCTVHCRVPGQSCVEAEGSALTEASKDDSLAWDPGLDLGLDEAVDISSGRLHANLILWTVRVEGLEVEPCRHHDPGVEGDRHLVSARTDQLHAARLDVRDLRSPAMTRVSEAVEEDDSGRVLKPVYCTVHVYCVILPERTRAR